MPDIAQLSIQVDTSSVPSAKNALEGLGNTSSWLDGIVTKMVAAFGLFKLAQLTQESILLAARYETLGVAMDVVGRNAGYTSAQMAGFQAQLEHTGISMLESRNNLARMAAAQLDLTKSSDLARVAQDAAVIAGINSSEAFERMVQGIVSGQPKILHTMGIFADFGRAEREWADAHGVTAKELDTATKVQIRMNEVLVEGQLRAGAYEASMNTAGKQIKSMERYVQDLQVKLGGVFGPALQQVVFDFVGQLKAMSTNMDALQKSGGLLQLQDTFKSVFGTAFQLLVGATKSLWEHRDALLVIGAAYVTFKTTAAVSGIVSQIIAWVATQQVLAASSASTTALLAAQAAATYGLSVAEAEAVVETAALATSTVSFGTASAVAGTAISALAPPITILITLLAAAGVAWYLFRDKTSENASASTKSLEDQTKALEAKLQKQKDYWDLVAHGATKGDASKALRETPEESSYYVKALADLEEVRKKIMELSSGFGPGGVFKGSDAVLGTSGFVNRINELKTLNEQYKEGSKSLSAYVQLYKKIQSGSDDVEADQIARAKAGRGGKVAPAGAADTNDFNKLDEALKKHIILLEQGKRAEEEYSLSMANLTAAQRKKLLAEWDQVEALKADQAAQKKDRTETEAMLDTLLKQRETYDLMGASVETLAKFKAEDLGLTGALAKAYIDQAVAIDTLKKAQEGQKRLASDARQIEDRSMTTQEKQVADLARLDAMLKGGVINLTAYRREWLRLQQEGTSTAGLLADAWTTSVNGMGTAFANFVATGKGSFKSLVSSILADLARLESNKAFAALLDMGLTALGIYFNPDVVASAGNPDISGLPTTSSAMAGSGSGYTSPTSAMIAPSSGGKGGISTSIVVNVNSDGQASSKADASGRNAAALGQMIDGKVKQIIVGEMRPGGLLNPVGGTA